MTFKNWRNETVIAIYDPPYAVTEAEVKKNDQFIVKLDELLAQKKYGQAIKAFLSDIGMPKVFIFFLPLMPGWSQMKKLAPTLKYDMLLTRDTAPVKRFEKLKVPALIMFGGKNEYNFKSVVEQLAAAIPGSQASEVEGQDHMVSAKLLLPYFKKFFSGI